VPTDFYTRMTPVRWWDYPLWATSALLIGLIAATYVRVGDVAATGPDRSRRANDLNHALAPTTGRNSSARRACSALENCRVRLEPSMRRGGTRVVGANRLWSEP